MHTKLPYISVHIHGQMQEACGASAILESQRKTSGRSIVTCGALQAVHLNLSLPGTYALVK